MNAGSTQDTVGSFPQCAHHKREVTDHLQDPGALTAL